MERVILIIALLHMAAGQSCWFDAALIGNWTSTSYGQMIFSNSSPQLVMDIQLESAGSTIYEFDCLLIDGTQHVVKSSKTIQAFTNFYIIPHLCLDLRKAGQYSYYFYLNSGQETGLQGERAVGLENTTTSVSLSDVCTTTLDTAEFHTIIKDGFESQASIQCADPLLVSATYTITDATQTYCADINTTLVDSCSLNLTNVQFNESMIVNDQTCLDQSPGFSTDGNLGCLTNIFDSSRNLSYITLYNYDTSLTSGVTFRFTCIAVASDENGTVSMSLRPTICEAGQTTKSIPSGGGRLMTLTPLNSSSSCVPVEEEETLFTESKDWTWLIVLCVLLFLLVVAILIAVLICLYREKKRREKAREKKILITEEHPLAEVSMPLDAPSSMEPLSETAYLEMREDLFRTPRDKKKEKPMVNPMSESSMYLDFKSPRWSISKGQSLPSIPDDPYSEMSNGEIVPISPVGSKTARSLMNYKQRSFSTAFLEPQPAPLKKTELVRRASMGILNERSFVKSRPTSQITEIPQTPKRVATSIQSERSFFKSRPSSRKTEILQTPKGERSDRVPSRRLSRVSIKSMEDGNEKAKSIAPSTTSNKADKSIKRKPAQNDKPKSGRRLSRTHGVVSTKFGRSMTSTQLGSVTHQKPNSFKKPKMRRSSTIVEPTLPVIAKAKEGEKIEVSAMNELVAAETGSSLSETARSKKSSPRRKSIPKQMTGIPNYFSRSASTQNLYSSS